MPAILFNHIFHVFFHADHESGRKKYCSQTSAFPVVPIFSGGLWKRGFDVSEERDVALTHSLPSFQGPWFKILNTRTRGIFSGASDKGVGVLGGMWPTFYPHSRWTPFSGAPTQMPRLLLAFWISDLGKVEGFSWSFASIWLFKMLILSTCDFF